MRQAFSKIIVLATVLAAIALAISLAPVLQAQEGSAQQQGDATGKSPAPWYKRLIEMSLDSYKRPETLKDEPSRSTQGRRPEGLEHPQGERGIVSE